MATVFKRENPNGKKSPYWYASFKRADGNWIKKSTKQTDLGKAKKIADAWETAEQDAAGGTLTEVRTREILNETLRRTGDRGIEVKSARHWLTEWLREKETSTKERTVAEYRHTITSFLEELGDRADLPVEAILTSDVRQWRDMLRRVKKLHPGTVNQRVRILRMPFDLARAEGILKVNPAGAKILKALPVTDEQRMEKGTFTVEHVKKLLTVAEGDWQGVIRLAFFTGARLRDLTNLRWENIDLAAGTMTFQPMKTDRKKKQLTITLHRDLSAWLLAQPTSDDGKAYLFPALANRQTGGRQGLSYEFQKIMTAAGIATEYDYEDAEGAARKRINLSFHSFRHSFATLLANAGVPAEIRQKLTGHASAEIHAGYTHLDLEVLRNATNKLPGIS